MHMNAFFSTLSIWLYSHLQYIILLVQSYIQNGYDSFEFGGITPGIKAVHPLILHFESKSVQL